MAHEAGDDVTATMSATGTSPSARQKMLWRMAVVLANVDYFEELGARLMAGATFGEEAVALTQKTGRNHQQGSGERSGNALPDGRRITSGPQTPQA